MSKLGEWCVIRPFKRKNLMPAFESYSIHQITFQGLSVKPSLSYLHVVSSNHKQQMPNTANMSTYFPPNPRPSQPVVSSPPLP